MNISLSIFNGKPSIFLAFRYLIGAKALKRHGKRNFARFDYAYYTLSRGKTTVCMAPSDFMCTIKLHSKKSLFQCAPSCKSITTFQHEFIIISPSNVSNQGETN